jgi:plasmid stabilization system protein ParE
VREQILRPATVSEIGRAYDWYERQREGLGEEFLKEVRIALEAAQKNPRLYPVVHRDSRRILVHRFPYGLFYRLLDETIVFVACYHTKRNPVSWKRRR